MKDFSKSELSLSEIAEMKKTWLDLMKISGEIYLKTGWKIPPGFFRTYLRSSAVGKEIRFYSLKKNNQGRFLVIHPEDAVKIVNQQVKEIKRFQDFCQKNNLGQAKTFRQGKAIARKYQITKIVRYLDLNFQRVYNLLKFYRIPNEKFTIAGILSSPHFRLIAFPAVENMLESIGEKATKNEASRKIKIRQGKKILQIWWKTKDIVGEIEKAHPEWKISVTQVKNYMKKNYPQDTVFITLPNGKKKYFFKPSRAKRVVRKQIAEIARLKKFANSSKHFLVPQEIKQPQDAKRLLKEWGPEAVCKRFGFNWPTFIKRHRRMRYFFPIIGIGEKRVSLISQVKFQRLLRNLELKLKRVVIDPKNESPTIEKVFKSWYTISRIKKDIQSKIEEWEIKADRIYHYIKSRAWGTKSIPYFKTQEFTGRQEIYVPPFEAQEIVKEQVEEIKKIRDFAFSEVGAETDWPQEKIVKSLLDRYGKLNTMKTLKLKEKDFSRLVQDGEIEIISFKIIGQGKKN